MSVRPKLRHYTIAIDREGEPTQEDGGALTWAGRWTPEHLVLAALARCTIIALDYHARRESYTLGAEADATGVVGPRDDGSWGFVEIDCTIDAKLDPPPPPERIQALIARAIRGCFVGQSLNIKPSYTWTVNGEVIS